VIAPDLPGHGFTDTPSAALSLPEMARLVAALLDTLQLRPEIVVGHSAGAAGGDPHGARRGDHARRHRRAERRAQAVPGNDRAAVPGIAKLLFANPFASTVFAAQARNPARVARLIEGTGSQLDAEGVELYARLFRNPGHVGATLGMMANWDLEALGRDYGRLTTPLTLVVGDRDKAVPPTVATQVAASVPGRDRNLGGLGASGP
jgi:magnesium chelatase accessory protein